MEHWNGFKIKSAPVQSNKITATLAIDTPEGCFSSSISHLTMAPYDTKSCGRRLVPLIIDQLALERPCETWISVPKSRDIKDGFRNVSYWALANAVNRLSWWIESRLGRSTNFETLAYIGANDARYFIILAAAMKTGYKVS